MVKSFNPGDKMSEDDYISKKQKQVLNSLVKASYTPKAMVIRAQIILLKADGKPPSTILKELKISYPPIYKWQERWLKAKPMLDQIEREKSKLELKKAIENVLMDAFRSGAPTTFSEEQVLKIIALACTSPAEEQLPVSHWSCRLLAKYAQKKGIVDSISYKQINVFLKSGAAKTAQGKMLVKF
jgi:putative transposase